MKLKRILAVAFAIGVLASPVAAWADGPGTTTSTSTTSTTAQKTMTVCIQGHTTEVPDGATNPTGEPYVKGPCPDGGKRTICINGKRTVEVDRADEDTIGEPYTLGPCPTKTNPTYTG